MALTSVVATVGGAATNKFCPALWAEYTVLPPAQISPWLHFNSDGPIYYNMNNFVELLVLGGLNYRAPH